MEKDTKRARKDGVGVNVLFWGSPLFSIPPLEALLMSRHHVVGVVTRKDKPAGRGKKIRPTPARVLAQERGIPVLQPARASDPDFHESARALHPEISVVAAYGMILKPEALSLPPRGSICIHPSLLPRYRGASPVQRAILAGEIETGVTIFQMDEGMDSGDVLLQEKMQIREGERAGDLMERLSRLSAEMVVDLLDRMEAGDVRAEPQNHEAATFAPKIEAEEGRIDWRKTPRLLVLESRAFDPWPGPHTLLGGERLGLFGLHVAVDQTATPGTPGEVIEILPEGPMVWAGDGCVIVTEIQSPGRRRMDAASWLRGRRLEPGTVLGR
jgi:methionyl-tRNA formyltransferase